MRNLILGIAVAIIILLTAGMAVCEQNGLVLYLPFDEGEGDVAEDLSGNGNDGVLVGGPEWVDGKFGKALEFDGADDLVNCGNANSLDAPQAITMEAWINPYEIHKSWIRIIQKCNVGGTRNSWCLIFSGSSQKLAMEIWDNGTLRDLKAASDAPLNGWTHVACTYDGLAAKIYINGILDNETQNVVSMDIGTNDLNAVVGSSDDDPRGFKGIIDEVRVWNRALEEGEIRENMHKGKEGFPAAVNGSNKLATVWGSIKDWR